MLCAAERPRITEEEEWQKFWEEDDVDPGDLAEDPPQAEIITVRFFRNQDGRIYGRVVQDVPGKNRTKIVFRTYIWKGPKPKHGQIMRVQVVNETHGKDAQPGDNKPDLGALIVELLIHNLKVPPDMNSYAPCMSCGSDVRIRDENLLLIPTNPCHKCGAFYRISEIE